MSVDVVRPAHSGGAALGWAGNLAAMAFLGLFAAGAVALVMLRSDEDWDRLVFVFSGVESVAFAAAGTLLGTRVSRQSVVTAEADAEYARREAVQAQAQAESVLRDAEIARQQQEQDRVDALAGRRLLGHVRALTGADATPPGFTEEAATDGFVGAREDDDLAGAPATSAAPLPESTATARLGELSRVAELLFSAPGR